MNYLAEKCALAGGTSLVVAESVSVEPLISALITLAISIVSVLAVDGINWLKSYIQSKTKQHKSDKDDKEV